jgi:hypothetical protein
LPPPHLHVESAFSLEHYVDVVDLRAVAAAVRDESAVGHMRRRARAHAVRSRRDAAHLARDAAAERRHGGHEEAPAAASVDGGGDGDGDSDEDAADPPSGGSGGGAAGIVGERSDAVAAAAAHRRRAFMTKYRTLNCRLAELVEDFSLVAFVPISLREPASLLKAQKAIDKCNGFVPLRTGTGAGGDVIAATSVAEWEHERVGEWQEKYAPRRRGGSEDEDGGGDSDEEAFV